MDKAGRERQERGRGKRGNEKGKRREKWKNGGKGVETGFTQLKKSIPN